MPGSVNVPDQVLRQLLEGNRRYAAYGPTLNESPRRRIEVAQRQQPFATVFSCVDSRVPPELVFDQGLGDLFVIRTAGQVLDKAVLGSLEFGVQALHIPLLIVLGHQRCGAIRAAIDVLGRRGVAEAEIEYLVEALAPSVERGKLAGGDVLDQAVRAQIESMVVRLKRSPILAAAVEAGTLKIVGAYYNLDTGVVELTVE